MVMGNGQWAMVMVMGDSTQWRSEVRGLLTSGPTASKGQDCACGALAAALHKAH